MLRASRASRQLWGEKGVLQEAATIRLNNLRDVPGAKHKEKRVGRGEGSGRGKTSCRGQKGHKSRTGRGPKKIFEGGQSHTALRMQKHGFSNKANKVRYETIHLTKLQRKVDQGLLPTDGTLVTMKMLKDVGVVSSIKQGVKILASGKLNAKLNLEVSSVSEGAKEAIEAAGGSVTTVYLNRMSLIQHLRKEPEDVDITFARAPRRVAHKFDLTQYANNRKEID